MSPTPLQTRYSLSSCLTCWLVSPEMDRRGVSKFSLHELDLSAGAAILLSVSLECALSAPVARHMQRLAGKLLVDVDGHSMHCHYQHLGLLKLAKAYG